MCIYHVADTSYQLRLQNRRHHLSQFKSCLLSLFLYVSWKFLQILYISYVCGCDIFLIRKIFTLLLTSIQLHPCVFLIILYLFNIKLSISSTIFSIKNRGFVLKKKFLDTLMQKTFLDPFVQNFISPKKKIIRIF